MRLFLLHPVDAIQRRFEERNIFTGVRPFNEFVLMLKLGRHTLPW